MWVVVPELVAVLHLVDLEVTVPQPGQQAVGSPNLTVVPADEP